MADRSEAVPQGKSAGGKTTRPGHGYVANADNKGWSLYGAPWLQPVATGRKSLTRENGENKRKPLRPAATDCLRDGQEGVDGSSPSEGFASFLLIRSFR